MVRQYYKGCDGFIVVYDITDRQSFKDIEDWVQDIKRNGNKGAIPILIGNKSDLEMEREVQY